MHDDAQPIPAALDPLLDEVPPVDDVLQPSYGIADVLFPVTPPAPKGARLVLGSVGLRSSSPEELYAERERPPALPETASMAETVEAMLSVVPIEFATRTALHRKRGRNKAARNKSLLAAAGWQ